MKRIETQGAISNIRQRSYFVRNATIEELLVANLKPEVRTAINPVCDTLVTRSFVLSQPEAKAFADKLDLLTSGKRGSKWIINVWQVQVVAIDFSRMSRDGSRSAEYGTDTVTFPPAWMDIVTTLSAKIKVLDIVLDMSQLHIYGTEDPLSSTSVELVFPILKMCGRCPLLTSLRIRCDVIAGLLTETPYMVVFDKPSEKERETLKLYLKEIILKGVNATVALDLIQYSTGHVEKFHWQQFEAEARGGNLKLLMSNLCQVEGIRDLEIFASNFSEEQDELFFVSPENLEHLEKIRVYMFTMDPKAIHSLSSIVMSKVDKLRDITVWCEDEMDDDSANLVLLFMDFVATCQRNLKKLCLGLPLKKQNIINHIRTILNSCGRLDSFIFGVHRQEDMAAFTKLAQRHKMFFPVQGWKNRGEISSENKGIRGWYEVKCTVKTDIKNETVTDKNSEKGSLKKK